MRKVTNPCVQASKLLLCLLLNFGVCEKISQVKVYIPPTSLHSGLQHCIICNVTCNTLSSLIRVSQFWSSCLKKTPKMGKMGTSCTNNPFLRKSLHNFISFTLSNPKLTKEMDTMNKFYGNEIKLWKNLETLQSDFLSTSGHSIYSLHWT